MYYKVGDKVRCIKSGGSRFITVNKHYTILKETWNIYYGDNVYWITCDDNDERYFNSACEYFTNVRLDRKNKLKKLNSL